jgi:hypothetical protein
MLPLRPGSTQRHSAARENDIEFILFMRVLVVRSLRCEEDRRHGPVFDCFNIPHTFWPPVRSGQRQFHLQLAERDFQFATNPSALSVGLKNQWVTPAIGASYKSKCKNWLKAVRL